MHPLTAPVGAEFIKPYQAHQEGFKDPHPENLPPSALQGITLNCVPCQNTEVSTARIERTFERNPPRLFGNVIQPGQIQWKTEPIALIAGGPTLKRTIKKVHQFKVTMVCGTAHDYVVEQGIVPTFAVMYDPIPENVDWFKRLQKDTLYIVASHCDEAIFEHLADFNVCIWHPLGDVPVEVFRNEAALGGGCMAVLRALNMAMFMGYWDQHYFGLDSCYLEDGTTHAYDNWLPPHACEVRIGHPTTGRLFKTSMGMLAQATQFFQQCEMGKSLFRATLYGDNMMAEMVRCGDVGEGGVRLGTV